MSKTFPLKDRCPLTREFSRISKGDAQEHSHYSGKYNTIQ